MRRVTNEKQMSGRDRSARNQVSPIRNEYPGFRKRLRLFGIVFTITWSLNVSCRQSRFARLTLSSLPEDIRHLQDFAPQDESYIPAPAGCQLRQWFLFELSLSADSRKMDFEITA